MRSLSAGERLADEDNGVKSSGSRDEDEEVTRRLELRENQSHVEVMACSSGSDDVFPASPDNTATNKHPVNDVTKEKATAPASTANTTSFPYSTELSYVDAFSRLLNKNSKRYTLELDLSEHALFTTLIRGCSLSKPLPVMRKSTSCCELSVAATAPQVYSKNQKSTNSTSQTSETSTCAPRPLLQLQFGQKAGVACHQTKSGTSFALINVTSGTRTSLSTDVEKQPKSRDLNDNANNEDKRTTLAQTEMSWMSSMRSEPSYENESNAIAEKSYFGVDYIQDNVIQRSSNNSTSHERQLIFV